jgi:SAM-dependent methyltransferase
VDPADFYTGLVADLYAPLRSSATDPEPYARFVHLAGEPALELGCGDGDPLLELRRRGLDVDGIDASADMLARLRRRAAATDPPLDVAVHHQRMEALDLPRRYRTVFLAGPTFNLLPDDDTALAALERIRAHLAPGGSALIPLFVTAPVSEAELGQVREATEADGSTIRFGITSSVRDEAERRQVTMTRYERLGRDPGVLERAWVLHWHTQAGFRALAERAGLATVAVLDAGGDPAPEEATEIAFWLQAAG